MLRSSAHTKTEPCRRCR